MIPNYSSIYPQLTIAQVLEQTSAAPVQRLHGLVVGPQYLLSRFGKEVLPVTGFSTGSQELPFTYLDELEAVKSISTITHTVDQASVRLFGSGLEASLASFASDGNAAKFYLSSLMEPNVIRLNTKTVAGATEETLDARLNGRGVSVGDIVYVNDGVSPAPRRRKVIGLRGKTLVSNYGTNDASDNKAAANSAFNPITSIPVNGDLATIAAPEGFAITTTGALEAKVRGSKLGNRYGEEFILTVTKGGLPNVAEFTVSSASGLWNAVGVKSAAGAGSTFSITSVAAGGELAGVNVVLTPTAPTTTVEVGQVFQFQIFGRYDRLAAAQLVTSDTGAGYTGPRNTTYMVQVVTGSVANFTNAVVRVSDSAGIDVVQNGVVITAGQAINLGTFGLKLAFTAGNQAVGQGGLRAGDIYFINAVASVKSSVDYDTVVCDGPVVDPSLFTDTATPLAVEFRTGFSGEIAKTAAADGQAWTANASRVLTSAALSLKVGDTWAPFANGIGTLSVEFRALVRPTANEDVFVIETAADIEAKAGVVDLDNDLGYGASRMRSGAQGRMIYGLRTDGTGRAAFAKALRKVESSKLVYALAVMTDDLEAIQAATDHVATMSNEENRKFRRLYFGSDSPGEYPVLQAKPDGSNFTCTIRAMAGTNVLVHTDDDVDFNLLNLAEGDLLKLVASGDTYVIREVLPSGNELILEAGPDNPISPAVGFQIWKSDSPESQADYISQRSMAVANRRAVNVWTENGTAYIKGVRTVIPNRFIAAEVAGLRTAVLPQQGLTRTEITSITDASPMYLRYDKELLNKVASHGVFIVTQDSNSGGVYIRHQLTTETDKGSLYFEDNAGVNLDVRCFNLDDILDSQVGKKNATPRVVSSIRTQIVDSLSDDLQVDAEDIDLGPPLLGYEDLVVEIDPTLRDQINVSMTDILPLPLNRIKVVVKGSVNITAKTTTT